MVSIDDVMTHNPTTLSQFNSLADARQLMREKKFRHIPIVNEHKELIGLLSERDVFQHGVSSQSYMTEEELASIETGTLISDIMTREVTTIDRECPVRHAAELIYRKKYGCLPVVNANKQLLGIITDHDFVAITIHLLQLLEENEPLELDDD